MTLIPLWFTEETSTPGIQYYSKQIFQLNVAPDTAAFAKPAQCFNKILHDILFYLSTQIDVWRLLFEWILECVRYTVCDEVWTELDMTASGHESDYWLWTYLSWGEVLQSSTFSWVQQIITFLWLAQLHVSSINASSSLNYNYFLNLWNLVV